MSAVGIVGAGRAGVAVARALRAAGWRVEVYGRGAAVASDLPVILLAVPDAAIPATSARLAVSPSHTVLHLAGPLGVEALAPLRDTGAALGAWHPLLSLQGDATDPALFRGALVALDGDDRALAAGRELADAVGLVSVVIRGPDRTRYHAGAVFAANYLVTLGALAERLMVEAGVPREVVGQGVSRLMGSALAQLAVAEPGAALTGPIARGDWATVRRHLDVLSGSAAEAYRALAKATAEVAGRPVEPDALR